MNKNKVRWLEISFSTGLTDPRVIIYRKRSNAVYFPALASLRRVLRLLAPPEKTCKWSPNRDLWGTDYWDTSCNYTREMAGTPANNQMVYCPFCGRKIEEEK
jgi:hypothetical protein